MESLVGGLMRTLIITIPTESAWEWFETQASRPE